MTSVGPSLVPGVPGIGPDPIPPMGAEGGEVLSLQSGWRVALRTFAENKLAVVALGLIVFFVLFCFVGPHIYHTNQTGSSLLGTDDKPSGAHWFGTDDNGFDELGRIMIGGQSALEIGLLSAVVATVVGTLYGAISGLVGGLFDGFLMRINDILLAIPTLFLLLVLCTVVTRDVFWYSILIGFTSWNTTTRLVRGEVLTLRVRDFISAARSMGSSQGRLVMRHLIPNALSVVIVNVTFTIADSIGFLAVLGFLGYGLEYPDVSWGDMLGDAEPHLSSGYWWLVFPVGICLVLVILAINLVGDALRDMFDVRLRRR
jgi:ABC-type dipeptide/oligopeptide/nickel transport system permease subunit